MVSTLSLEEKYSKIRRRLCFYLDIEDQELSRSLSRRLQDMGLQQEWVVSPRVTHAVVGGRGAGGADGGAPRRARGSRADAMLQRCAAPPPPPHARLSVRQAISLLDKLYDTFFAAPRKSHVTYFTKDFIKIEFLDKLWKPVYKEFDEFPEFSLEPDVPREKKEKRQTPETQPNDINQNITSTSQKMTRKSRPRIKEKEDKEPKGGYCEMCHADYTDLEIHRRSPQHVSFVRDHNNFLALDSLIAAGADVATFLAKDAAALNGERRSLRKICNGDVEQSKTPKRSKRSQSPDSTINGDPSPPPNGIDDDRKHNTRCSKRSSESQNEDRQYYRVVGVSTKLRSSGGFATKKKESPPPCNGAKPLVVKFRKVRKSELSVLSDEAEQFMFPKRASSSSSTTSSEDEKEPLVKRRPSPPPAVERRRQARPLALKEESSEEDSWPDTSRRPKRRVVVTPRKGRRMLRRSSCTATSTTVTEAPEEPKEEKPPTPVPTAPAEEVLPELPLSPTSAPEVLQAQTDCVMRWQDGRLQYPPAVEQLEFAFECVPHSEPWFHTFRRQDEQRLTIKNVPEFFALYSTAAPKLPYEIGQLPPLKANCCPLSALVRGPSRGRGGRGGRPRGAAGRVAGAAPGARAAAYGTRGLLQATRAHRRGSARAALDPRPRKSPREHASTLAIAGLLRRADDATSTASDDTGSDTLASLRRAASPPAPRPAPPAPDHACERLREFLDDVFEDAGEYDVPVAGDTAVLAPTAPDVPDLVSECDACDVLRDHLREATASPAPAAPSAAPRAARRQRPRKKNRTGWPSKRKTKKDSRAGSLDSRPKSDSLSGNDRLTDVDDEGPQETAPDSEDVKTETESTASEDTATTRDDDELATVPEEDTSLKEEVATPVKEEEKDAPDSDLVGRVRRRGAGAAGGGGGAVASWLQPVVRVARVQVCARRLRSAAAARHRVR